ncbi:hypothetical protein LTR66_009778 [Elasticomyces elasticus]|nr:hypothetical protein LTR66_009778 [Elasticomyces elasticus]
MAEAAQPTSPPVGETPTQRAARERRERRNAKLQTGGTDRLNKITQLNGRIAPGSDNTSAVPKSQPSSILPSVIDDPAEIDISEHHYTPRSRDTFQSRENSWPNPQMQNPFAGLTEMGRPGADGAQTDPMMQMMQQMLGGGGGVGGAPGDPNNPNPMGDLPPFLQAMMGNQQQAQQPASGTAYIWRIVHALFSLLLALYIALTSPFNGSKFSRLASSTDIASSQKLFYMFATAELVLQSSRYFLEKGQLQGGGILATVGSVLPEPWAGYLRLVGRYSTIYTTVVADAMVIVFVLGTLAWWKGMAVA